MSKRLALLAAILVGTLVLRAYHLRAHLDGPLGDLEKRLDWTDNHAFATWAWRIAEGDLLCRNTFHPRMDWMAEIGHQEQFERWWGGKAIYHQTPLYPYLLAASYGTSGSKVPMLVLQVLLSAASVYLLYMIGAALMDETAGLVAAAFAAVYAPSVVFDALLLRSSLSSSLTITAVWLLLLLRKHPRWDIGLTTGPVLALGFFLRPTGLALMIAGPLLLATSRSMREPGWLRRWALPLVAGIVIVFAPFVARNLAVGAPALTFSTRGPETVIQGNHRGADPALFVLPDARDYRDMMDRGHGGVTDALSASIDTWPRPDQLSWWMGHEVRKLIASFRDFEYPNNVNVYYYRRATPLLAYLPTFGSFCGLALVGLVVLFTAGRDRVGAGVLLLAVAAALGGLLLGIVSSRFRTPMAMLLTVPAGATVTLLVRWIRARRLAPALLMALAAAGLSALSFLCAPTRISFEDGEVKRIDRATSALIESGVALRPQEFVYAAQALKEDGRHAEAEALLDDYLAELRAFVDASVLTALAPGQDRVLADAYNRLRHWAEYLGRVGFVRHDEQFRKLATDYFDTYKRLIRERK